MDRSYGDKLRKQIREGRNYGADHGDSLPSATKSPAIRPRRMQMEWVNN